MKKILILGATSGIAVECARKWARQGAEMFLVARDDSKLKQVSDDLVSIGAGNTYTHSMDFNAFEKHKDMLELCVNALKEIDIVLVAHGTLPDQNECQINIDLALEEYSTNCLSSISLLTHISNILETQKKGTIAVLSSVAADRGRQSNYLYGSAKAAVTVFCEGLRVRMFKSGVHVLVIKPGFVLTPMTESLDLPGLLVSSADKVADIILKAIDKKRDVIYAPYYWTFIMLIIKNIPGFVFKRLTL